MNQPATRQLTPEQQERTRELEVRLHQALCPLFQAVESAFAASGYCPEVQP